MVNEKFFCLLLLCLCPWAIAEESNYPFEVSDNLQAQIDINTSNQARFNNKLLATNIFRFETEQEQDFIDFFSPTTIRFPHGLWANWYDWRTDSSRVFGTESFQYKHADGSIKTKTIDHLASLKIFEVNQTKIGINGLAHLNEKHQRKGKVFDMVWTFNMSADGSDFDDGSPETVSRYQDLISRGFAVTDIEMGNENFYPGQRSSIIPNIENYIARAKSMSQALKALNPNIRLSIPLLRRDSWANPNWNRELTSEQDYFDAVTVHTYVGTDPDNSNNSDEAYATALTARYHLAKSVNDYALKVAPSKPIWLTEWGVNSGGANAASALGMADAYIYMSENQDIYDRANWFSVNGRLNSFVVWEEYVSPSGVLRPRIKYPLVKTAFGLTHQIVREVLENSVLLDATITTEKLSYDINAISTRAVIQDKNIVILALNLTDEPANFDILIDGKAYTGHKEHTAMTFVALDEERVLPANISPMSEVLSVDGVTRLPKLSINKIVLQDVELMQNIFDIELTTQNQIYAYDEGDKVPVVATIYSDTSEVRSVSFMEAGKIIYEDKQTPFQMDWHPSGAGIKEITASAIRVDGVEVRAQKMKINMREIPLFMKVTLVSTTKKTLTTNDTIALSAKTIVNKGEVSHVDFQVNGQTLSTVDSEPYTYQWRPSTPGSYNVSVVANHASGAKVSSAVTVFDVVQVSTQNTVTNVPVKDNRASGGSLNIWLLSALILYLKSFYCNINQFKSKRKSYAN